MCLNDEPNWRNKPLFQLKSMAQTRALAKALRNVMAWVVVLAGYSPTPAEEMDDVQDNGIKQPQRKVQPPAAKPPTNGESLLISEPQRKRLWAIAKGAGVSEDLLREITERHGFKSGKDITRASYEAIVTEVEGCLR
jgi:hypothetical protein